MILFHGSLHLEEHSLSEAEYTKQDKILVGFIIQGIGFMSERETQLPSLVGGTADALTLDAPIRRIQKEGKPAVITSLKTLEIGVPANLYPNKTHLCPPSQEHVSQ